MTQLTAPNPGRDKVDLDLSLLMDCFRQMLLRLGLDSIAAAVPWVDAAPPRQEVPLTQERLSQVLAISFQLLNMAEENAANQARRAAEIEHGLTGPANLWPYCLRRLTRQGFTQQQIAAALPDVHVEPVLTAHPTEAKRAGVLEQHRVIFLLLFKLENSMWTPAEREQIIEEIRLGIELLWRTGEVLLSKPNVADERRNIMYYLRSVFPLVLPRLDQRLAAAWQEAGFDPQLISGPEKLPRVTFGSWVGGDRDGHALVTGHVTEQTLSQHRAGAVEVLRDAMTNLSSRLALSTFVQEPSQALLAQIDRLRARLGAPAERIVQRHRDEPWRQSAQLIMAMLPRTIDTPYRAPMIDPHQEPAVFQKPAEMAGELQLLRQSLIQIGARHIALAEVDRVLRLLDVFGFHLAKLDIRQNSSMHDKALAQIMTAGGIDAADFATWDEPRRLELLLEELKRPRPFLQPDVDAGEEATLVLGALRTVAQHIRQYGPDGIGSLIVSMTENLSDLLVVYALCREVGLLKAGPDGLHCQVPVVPLFETLDDLEQAPDILGGFLDHPITQRTLHAVNKPGPITQQVMIGYSDSNKDAGIFASQWVLHKAQRALTQTAESRNVKLRFFHGQGGTISRGAGPTHRFLQALPHGSLTGDLRITVQGEAIAQKYANQGTATFNLELLTAGVSTAMLEHQQPSTRDHRFDSFKDRLADHSREAYRQLLEHDMFLKFFRQATPIDALERSGIGSRPARRTGSATLDDLRAIPWVFSWSQARFFLPGWFGIGTALETAAREEPDTFKDFTIVLPNLQFAFYLLTNVEAMTASADKTIMKLYASLVTDRAVRKTILEIIFEEYDRTVRMLQQIFGSPIELRRPRLCRSIERRAAPLAELHAHQVRLLEQWRDKQHSETLLPQVLLSINAIAAGLRGTG